MRKLPPLSYLQAFEAAARHQSFTEAARELNCTQAAISQRIRALEASFGRPLFVRLANGVQTTEGAEVYLHGIAEALDQLSSITRGLAGGRRSKLVSISVPVTFASLWLAPRLRLFMSTHPEIDVRLNCTIWNDPNSEISDLQILLLGSERSVTNGHALTRDRAFIVCSPGLLARREGALPRVHFPQDPLIVLVAKYDYWELWKAKSGALRIGNGRSIEVDTGIAALELARHGQGIALTLASYIAPYLETGQLVKPFEDSIDLNLSHFIFRPPDRALSRPAELFYDFMVEQGRLGMVKPPEVLSVGEDGR